MQTIKPFINLGWNTVPLRGDLVRLPDGTKTQPKFEQNWKEKYAKTVNTIQSKLGGVITGKSSNLLAIDCDNNLAYNLFHSLDPEYTFIFKSKGKLDSEGNEKDCGTILYEYTEEIADNFSINNGTLALDVYAENGFVYLPTEANKTKVPWSGKLPALKPIPTTALFLLQQLKLATAKAPTTHITQNVLTANCLAPLVQQFVTTRKFLPGLFKIITPKDFRTEPQYVEQGFLHPENIPEGRGSEYLSKVSAILGADISIDEELYNATMHDINELWPSPMDPDRLDNTITDHMVSGKAAIEGKAIWQYDENWSSYRLVLHTKRQSSVELGFDDRRNLYYCVDINNEHVKYFNRDAELISYIGSVAIEVPTKPELKKALPIINVTSLPSRPFGFFADSDPTARTLNTFIRTPELCIMDDPDSYAAMYKPPTTTLRYLETLVPETAMREYLLGFLKHKLKTFEYSPVMLYFLGAPGSGKDTFVSIIEKIMGRISRPTTKEFLEVYNSYMLDTYFVQLDEYGDQLTTIRDKEEALGKLKAYTGKKTITVRQMRTDGFQYDHGVTFISTANKNPFGLEDGDRRIALFNTPTPLIEAEWVDDITIVHDKIMAETKDFCYYLAKHVKSISRSEYMKPPETENKKVLIADSMYAAKRLAYALKHSMFDYIKDLCSTYACSRLPKALSARRILVEDVEELYEILTDYKGDTRSLNKAMKQIGIELKPATINNERIYYYNIPAFKGEPFDAD